MLKTLKAYSGKTPVFSAAAENVSPAATERLISVEACRKAVSMPSSSNREETSESDAPERSSIARLLQNTLSCS